MLINGPAEWSEALLATGVKANLLQNGYIAKLKISAMPLGPTIAITCYADTDVTQGFGRGVPDQPAESLVLHEEDSKAKTAPHYRLAAWSNGSTDKSLLAIASANQVEIWEITVASGICATLKGSIAIEHLQSLAWNPRHNVLLAYSATTIDLIDASQQTLLRRAIYANSSTRQAWGSCSWSPCGLQVSIAQNHILHCFRWESVDSLLSEPAKHDQIDASSSVSGNGHRLDVGHASVGPIAAVARVSPTICILTTDTKLILEDISRADPAITTKSSAMGNIIPAAPSSLLLLPDSSKSSLTVGIREEATQSSSGIVDLMSMRVSSSSTQNSLQILKRFEDESARQRPPQAKPRSHLVIAEFKAAQWSIISILELPRLTSPDIAVVQDMRVIVGSTLSPRLLVAHLDVSDSMAWTASLSGELELPPTQVCRGIYLAERSPFVDVASTEKRKRATFFHAAASAEPQPVYLSKFKVPRRKRPASSGKSQDSAQEAAATAAAPVAAAKTPKCSDGSENRDLLELLLASMTAMQTQLNARFDRVDEKLLHLTARVEQLERNTSVGPCPK